MKYDEQTIKNMLTYLCELYVSISTYPHTIKGMYDIPNPKYITIIQSKDELIGRIKQLGQLLNARLVMVDIDTKQITLDLERLE